MHNNSTFFSTRPQHFVLEPHITCCSPRLLLLHNIFSCNACFFSSSSTLRLLWHHVRYTLLATMCFVCSSVKLFRFCVSFVDLLKWKHNAYSTLFLTTTSKTMMMLIEGCTTKKILRELTFSKKNIFSPVLYDVQQITTTYVSTTRSITSDNVKCEWVNPLSTKLLTIISPVQFMCTFLFWSEKNRCLFPRIVCCMLWHYTSIYFFYK